MGKYIKLFETNSEYQAYKDSDEFMLPNVVKINEAITPVYNYAPKPIIFTIEGEEYSINTPMTWAELFQNQDLPIHQQGIFYGCKDEGLEITDTCCFGTLYIYNESNIACNICTWSAHIGACGCAKAEMRHLYDSENNIVNVNDVIIPTDYKLIFFTDLYHGIG